MFSNYNEFAYVMPRRDRLIYSRTVGGLGGSLEYWTANLDGSDPEQLTSFSKPSSLWYDGVPSIAGSLAFDPGNPNRFVAGLERNLQGDFRSVLVTLD
jgi:hypothetical protein